MPIALRMVAPLVRERERECTQLEEDLKKMRCEGLLAWLWMLKDENW